MSKIIIDCRESGTSTGRYLDKLIENLYKLKPQHDFVLLVKHHRKDFLKSIAPGFKCIETPYQEFTFGEQLGFKKQINKLKPDLVFFPMAQQPIWYSGKVVTMIQDLTTTRFRNPAKNWLSFTFKREVYKYVVKRVARKSTLLLSPTEFVRQDVANYAKVSPQKITVTYESADKITEPAIPINALKSERFLLFVGRPAANKNLNRLVDAFAILRKKDPDLVLVMAGKTDNEYKKLRDYARAKVGRGVLFTGFVSDGQLRWLYENAQVYVFPSLSEGFGLPGLEAMHYDLPVASSNATCLPEVYQDAAHYFNPFSSPHIAKKIQEILDDPVLAKKLTKNGRQQLTKYSWRTTAKQTLAVLEDALKQ